MLSKQEAGNIKPDGAPLALSEAPSGFSYRFILMQKDFLSYRAFPSAD